MAAAIADLGRRCGNEDEAAKVQFALRHNGPRTVKVRNRGVIVKIKLHGKNMEYI